MLEIIVVDFHRFLTIGTLRRGWFVGAESVTRWLRQRSCHGNNYRRVSRRGGWASERVVESLGWSWNSTNSWYYRNTLCWRKCAKQSGPRWDYYWSCRDHTREQGQEVYHLSQFRGRHERTATRRGLPTSCWWWQRRVSTTQPLSRDCLMKIRGVLMWGPGPVINYLHRCN